MKFILTSYLDTYDKDENGNRIAKNFGNENHILDILKKYILNYDNFLFVASDEYNFEATDVYANVTFESFNLTLPFKNYKILDSRTEKDANKLIKDADLIFLCGGHLPTQNKFFNRINLKDKLSQTDAFIIGGSAGAMNMAENVYSIPELEGESIDPNFKRSLVGLGLTDINILPHYDAFTDVILDGKKFVEEIVLPDTYKRTVYALNNGSYILVDGKNYLYGEAYLLKDGRINKINNNDEIKII